MSYRGVGHRPVPDPTNTYCTMPGCDRFLQSDDPTMHRRGSGGRSRFGDPPPPRLRRPLRAEVGEDVVADIKKLAERAIAAALETSVRANPALRGVGEQVDGIEKLIAAQQEQIDFLSERLDRLADRLAVYDKTRIRVVDPRDNPGDWRNQRPDRRGQTRTSA